jgi:hypothetical protein
LESTTGFSSIPEALRIAEGWIGRLSITLNYVVAPAHIAKFSARIDEPLSKARGFTIFDVGILICRRSYLE